MLAIGSKVGKAYEVGGWEVWAQVETLYEAGEYEAAIEMARPIADANPQYGSVLYNLACCEALAGRKEDAIGHLGIALERRPGRASWRGKIRISIPCAKTRPSKSWSPDGGRVQGLEPRRPRLLGL